MKFQWGVDCQNVFAQLKTAVITILALSIDDDNYVIDTDVSGLSIGALLSQEQAGQDKVIAYASKLLNLTEQSYFVKRRELLVVIYYLKYFKKISVREEICDQDRRCCSQLAS